MARRSDHSRQQLSEMSLKAARKIVGEDGLQALTARRVASAINYSPGTLYNVFEDLDDLIIHLNACTLDELYSELSSTAMTGDPVLDLRELLKRYLGYLDANRNLWDVLFDHKVPVDRVVPDWYRAKVAKVLGLIERALSPLFPDGDQKACANAAGVLWASLHGICSLGGAGKRAARGGPAQTGRHTGQAATRPATRRVADQSQTARTDR